MKKKIIFCSGGTGGHVFPTISLISFFHLERFGMEYKTLAVATSRMMIMPLMAFIILNLI